MNFALIGSIVAKQEWFCIHGYVSYIPNQNQKRGSYILSTSLERSGLHTENPYLLKQPLLKKKYFSDITYVSNPSSQTLSLNKPMRFRYFALFNTLGSIWEMSENIFVN